MTFLSYKPITIKCRRNELSFSCIKVSYTQMCDLRCRSFIPSVLLLFLLSLAEINFVYDNE